MATTKIRTSTQVVVDANLDVVSNKIVNVATPTTGGDAVNKTYADGLVAAAGALTSSNFVYGEAPTGLVNGTNPTFTLLNTPIVGSVCLFRNGQRLNVGVGNDYTIAGATITMLTGMIPATGDILLADYRK